MINLNRADLDFLLRQVTINYLIPDGTGGFVSSNYFNYSALANALDPSGLREVSGHNNNLVGGYWDPTISNPVTGGLGAWVVGPNAAWGQADQPFLNLSVGQVNTSAQESAYNQPGASVTDPDPRMISNLVATMFTSAAQATIANASFETDSLASGGPGVVTDSLGNYIVGAPSGWTLSGTGGTYDPNWWITQETGHSGTNVAWLNGGATLSQEMGETLVAGANYSLTLRVGDRTDQAFGGGVVRLIASNGVLDTVLSSIALSAPGEGEWSTVTLDTGAIDLGLAGQNLRIEVANTGASQILVDDVALSAGSSNANPAAADAATNGGAGAQFEGLQFDGQPTAFIANAGVLGGGRFNQWFVSFGQFFDHGLDFVLRDSSATVRVPLSPNDPLYDADAGVTYIDVRRADVANPQDAGADNTFGTADDVIDRGADGMAGTADDTLSGTSGVYAHAQYINNTGLLIDQSQTYGSHESVNALIREYTPDGRPTGRVVTGNAAVLDDTDPSNDIQAVGLATWADIKANALRIGVALDTSPNIFNNVDVHDAPMLRVDAVGKLMFTPDPSVQWTTTDPWYKQILLDSPSFDINTPFSYGLQSANDPYARDANGDVLRTNQNMLIDFNPGQALDDHIITGDGRANENIGLTAVHHVFHEEHNFEVANIQQQILATGDTAFISQWATFDTGTNQWVWDGEKLYQAARIITESEYNHIAIDQFVGTLYGALPEFVSYSSDINMGVSLEFSQAVYRLGHSMLTETFNVQVPNDPNDVNAGTHDLTLLEAFINPSLYQQLGPNALANGLTTTLGNEIDEFVTPALQQMLLGQPIDLATINLTRGRDVGVPTWNEFRQQVFDQLIQNTNNTNGSALAPYTTWADVGDHLKSTGTLVNLIAAYARGDGDSTNNDNPLADAIVQARSDYSTGAVTLDELRGAAQALYDAYLDPTSTGYAEAKAFMEGTPTYDAGTGQWTFAGADLGFWDIDLWIGGLAERPLFDGPLGTTFSYVILDFAQRMQDGDRFYYLYRTPMGTNLGNEVIENQFGNLVGQHAGVDHPNGEVFIWANQTFTLTDGADYFDEATQTVLDVDGTPIPASDAHIIVAGLGGDDFIKGGLGDDTLYGDAGNDQIYGSQGNDHIFGGDGDDYIFDDENDDFITGGAGNDRIFAGPGALDTVFGDEGDDEIHGGDGIDELLGGAGDDLIYGDGDTDVLFGGDGNDYLDGGDSVDEMQGQAGNDWMRGGVGDDHLIGGDGNDLLEGGIGPTANDGDRLIGQGVIDFAPAGTVEVDLGFDVASYEDVDIAITANLDTSNQNGTGPLIDTYAGIDGLVGTRFNDSLTGADPTSATANGTANLLVGGGGDDTLTGLGDDDILVGDSVAVRNDLSIDSGFASTIANWKGTGDDRPVYAAGELGHFLGETGTAGTDTAVFRGNLADYNFAVVTYGGYDAIQVTDTRDPATADYDGTDILIDMEFAQFADQTISIVPSPPALDLRTADLGNVADNFSSGGYAGNSGSVNWNGSWTETNDGSGATGGDINIDGGRLHFGSSTDGNEIISRAANLAGAASATLSFNWQEDDRDAGENVLVQAYNGATWDTVGTLAGSATNGTYSFTQTLTAAQIGAGTQIRFAAESGWEGGENLYIDNVDISFSTPVNDASNNYSTTFTEDGPAVAIASAPGITDDSATMASAKIVLTNAQAGDALSVGILPAGITSSIDTSVAGVITVNLSGTASNADYQTAIQAVLFANSSQAPNTTPRVIEVTVNDGLWTSNLATTNVTVNAVDDPMVANNDTVVTNITDGSAFVVPTWALLANDTDPDGPVDITAVSESSSNFTATLVAAGVSITDSDGSNNSFTYTGTGTDTANVPVIRDTNNIDAGGGNQIIVGNGAGNTFDAGTGDDIVLAGGGVDNIIWNANTGTTDGHDFVDGGDGTDTFTVNGNNSAETFVVYARADAELAGIIGLNANTEIVVTRNGAVIAELDNIEEIQINTSGGTDNVTMVGDFSPTTLNYNTITVNGGRGNDIVDISQLTSDHRIVFHGGAGDNQVIGDLRPQDVVDNSNSASAATTAQAANGLTITTANSSAANASTMRASSAGNVVGASDNDSFVFRTAEVKDDDDSAPALQTGDRLDLKFGDQANDQEDSGVGLISGNAFSPDGHLIVHKEDSDHMAKNGNPHANQLAASLHVNVDDRHHQDDLHHHDIIR